MPLLLTPQGHLRCDPAALAALPPRVAEGLRAAAAVSSAEVLRWLATRALAEPLPATGVFWREYARRYFTALCHTPDLDASGSLTVQDIFDFLAGWFAARA